MLPAGDEKAAAATAGNAPRTLSPTPTLRSRTRPPIYVKMCSNVRRRRKAKRTATRPRAQVHRDTHGLNGTNIGANPSSVYTVNFAEFPYLRWWYRQDGVHPWRPAVGATNRYGLGFSRFAKSTVGAARDVMLYKNHIRISRRADYTDVLLYKEEKTLLSVPCSVCRIACFAVASHGNRLLQQPRHVALFKSISIVNCIHISKKPTDHCNSRNVL